MAEFIFKDMVKNSGLSDLFQIASAATSREEIGNVVHPGTKKVLTSLGISTEGKRAVQMTVSDYHEYDYINAMDQWNILNINKIIEKDSKSKIKRLLAYTNKDRDIADPWYTGDFEQTYKDVYEGCKGLLYLICEEHHISL
jgi:protein-tyrosine phosphatase